MRQPWIDALDLWAKSMGNGFTSLKRKRREFRYLLFKSLRLRFRLVVISFAGIIGILESDRFGAVASLAGALALGPAPGLCELRS